MITYQDIEKIFGEQLSKIINPVLRRKIVETWVKACQEGNKKDIKELERLPFTIATNANRIRLIQHVKAATEGAFSLAKIQKEYVPEFPNIEMDIIVAGALVNDINKVIVFELNEKGKFIKKDSSTFPGVEVTRKTGLPDSIVKIVEYECNGSKGRPSNIETIFIQHADFITFDSMDYLNSISNRSNKTV